MAAKKKLAEGKTKIIWEDPDIAQSGAVAAVLVESKDDITAHDGLGHELLTGKAVAATTTTCNMFEVLGQAWVPTHYRERVDERTFRADWAEMVPIEVVMRRLAYGSFLKRHPEIEPKSRFDPVRVEFFGKDDDLSPPEDGDDTMNDPLLVLDFITNRTLRFKPKRPMGEQGSFIDELPGMPGGLDYEECQYLATLGQQSFEAIETALRQIDVVIVDLKIECGRDTDGDLVVADVIDNDSWRIWPGGDEKAMKDKELFRKWVAQGDPSDKEQQLAGIGEAYEWVAEATSWLFAT